MVHIDRYDFDKKCREVMDDIKIGEARSPAWIWMTIGAALGFIASCLRIKQNKGRPILMARRKVGKYNGIFDSIRDSKIDF